MFTSSSISTNLLDPLWYTQLVNIAVQLLGFAISAPLQTEKLFDTFGALGFFSVVSYSLFANASIFPPRSPRALLASATTLLWSARLGSFLLYRVITSGHGDRRFDELKKSVSKFFGVWMLQAVWIAVTSAPVVLVNCRQNVAYDKQADTLGTRDFVGLGIWLLGFGLEVLADRQKSAFNAKQGKEKKWIQEGLWRYSRHPNYFGDCILWLGQFILCSSGLRNATTIEWAAAAFSPIFVTFLLTQVSGIPLLEQSSDKKWGNIAAYQEYKRQTNVFVPWFKRW